MSDLPFDSPISQGVGEPPIPRIQQLPDSESRELRGDEYPVPGVHYVEWQGKEWLVARKLSLTEDEYVRREVDATRDYVRVNDIRDKHLNAKGEYEPTDPQVRLDISAKNARQRYRGYLAGEVFSL